mmetsp:Transcript_21354/g.48226  ORF Transcript_21354/g.48226 Transcript_21354/m.48226 type:complete len:327 (+) Transcript_21354:1195-2175(+)
MQVQAAAGLSINRLPKQARRLLLLPGQLLHDPQRVHSGVIHTPLLSCGSCSMPEETSCLLEVERLLLEVHEGVQVDHADVEVQGRVQLSAEPKAVMLVPAVCAHRFAVTRSIEVKHHAPLPVPQLHQCDSQASMEPRIWHRSFLQRHRLLVGLDGSREVSSSLMRGPKVEVRRCVVWLETDGAQVAVHSLINVTYLLLHYRQLRMRCEVIGADFDGSSATFHGLHGLTLQVLQDGHVEESVGRARAERKRALILRQRFRMFSSTMQHDTGMKVCCSCKLCRRAQLQHLAICRHSILHLVGGVKLESQGEPCRSIRGCVLCPPPQAL